jgi:glycosyltransferase involved in cell wall biosynthesis
MLMPERTGLALAADAEGASVELRPRRILHVVGRVDQFGIAISLMHMLRIVDRQRYRMDFMALNEETGTQEQEARALGCRVISCPARGTRPWRFAREFGEALRRFGPYDVIHSHVHLASGQVLRLAHRYAVPVRIAHSRNDTRVAEARRAWPRRLYGSLMRRWIRQHANVRLAISRSAAEDLFGPGWQGDGVRLIYSGRDFSGFADPAPRGAVRETLGIPADAFVLGHVGHFDWRKNHRWVVAVAKELFRRVPNAWLLLIGDGPRQAEIETLVRSLGIADRVVFAGVRRDVPRLVTGAMDAFVFPSHHEGLGLAAVEAQAAGLPCLLSDALPEEIDVIPELVQRLSLTAPPALWAERLLAVADARRPSPGDAYRLVQASEFSVERTTAKLCRIYDGCS